MFMLRIVIICFFWGGSGGRGCSSSWVEILACIAWVWGLGFEGLGVRFWRWCCFFVVLYYNFRSLAFLGLLGFLIRQLKMQFIATLLSAAKAC